MSPTDDVLRRQRPPSGRSNSRLAIRTAALHRCATRREPSAVAMRVRPEVVVRGWRCAENRRLSYGRPRSERRTAMTRRGWVLFGALSVIWGVPYLLIKIAVTDVDPLIVAFGRTLIAALLLLPIALYRRALMPVFRRWKMLLLYTVVEISGPWLLLGHAETTLNSSTAGLLLAVVPMIAAIILTVTGHDRFDSPPHPRARHRLRRRRLPGRLRHPVRRPAGGRRRHAGRGRLRDRADHHQPPAGRPAADGRGHRVADRGDGAVRAVRGLAVAGADHRAGGLVDRRARGDLHRDRVPGVLRADRRGRPGPGHRDHLHQPGGRDHPRRAAAERAVHRRHGDRLPAGDRRLGPGDRPRRGGQAAPDRVTRRPAAMPAAPAIASAPDDGTDRRVPAPGTGSPPRRGLERSALRQPRSGALGRSAPGRARAPARTGPDRSIRPSPTAQCNDQADSDFPAEPSCWQASTMRSAMAISPSLL